MLKLILIFSVLFIVLTFPLILNIRNAVPDVLGGDSYYFLWKLWKFRYTLFDLGENPFGWSNLIYYPITTPSLYSIYENIWNTLLSLPLFWLLGNDIVVYNSLIFTNVLLAGITMYFLVREFNHDKRVALLLASAYAFSPYAMHRLLGHLNLLTLAWIPLFLLFFIRLIKTPRIKYALASAFSLLLVAASSLHYLVFVSLAATFLLIWDFKIKSVKYYCIFALSGVIFVSPIVYPFAAAYFRGELSIPPPKDFVTYSADPLSYLIPSPFYLFGRGLTTQAEYSIFSGNVIESTAYLGVAEIALLLFFLAKRRELKSGAEWPECRKWLWFSLIFFLLSLGPYLKILGRITPIPLPIAALSKLPFFNMARDPVRFSILVMLGLLVFFAVALKYLSQKMPASQFKLFLLVLAAFFLLERIMPGLPLKTMRYPDFYLSLRNEKKPYALADLPLFPWLHEEYNFLQTIHQKYLLHGASNFADYLPGKSDAFLANDYFLNKFICPYQPNIPDEKPVAVAASSLPSKNAVKTKYLENNIAYLILHKNKFSEFPWCENVLTLFRDYFKNTPRFYEDGDLEVVRVNDL